ncbi:MAG: glycosyltransferase family 2 protein [Chitinispirillaceae bacterium]|nr:glycosyltransferase family 2 protein [Chitinispirillaceae bacterium]
MTIPISVVLPVYNRAAVIVRAIDSVLKQKPALFAVTEVIVIDDGSGDDTVTRVRQMTDPRVRLVTLKENRGACYARNRGVETARNEFVAFQDSDDVWYEEKLSALGGVYRPDIDVYFSAFHKIGDGKKALYPDWLKKSEYKKGELIRCSLIRNPLSTATLLIRKKALQDAGGFDEQMRRFQDWELVLRVFGRSPVLFVNQPLAAVEVRADSMSRNFRSGILSRRYILKKHLAAFLRHPFLLLRSLAGLAVRMALAPFKPAACL